MKTTLSPEEIALVVEAALNFAWAEFDELKPLFDAAPQAAIRERTKLFATINAAKKLAAEANEVRA